LPTPAGFALALFDKAEALDPNFAEPFEFGRLEEKAVQFEGSASQRFRS
jgi:hypothetical protein